MLTFVKGHSASSLIIGAYVAALLVAPVLALASDGASKIVITHENRNKMRPTADQKSEVDKVVGAPELVNVSIGGVPGRSQRDHGGVARSDLILPDGKEVVLVQSLPTVNSERIST